MALFVLNDNCIEALDIAGRSFFLAGMNFIDRMDMAETIFHNGGRLAKGPDQDPDYMVIDSSEKLSPELEEAIAKAIEEGTAAMSLSWFRRLLELGSFNIIDNKLGRREWTWFDYLSDVRKLDLCLQVLAGTNTRKDGEELSQSYLRRHRIKIAKHIAEKDDSAAMDGYLKFWPNLGPLDIDGLIEICKKSLRLTNLLLDYKEKRFTIEDLEVADALEDDKAFGLAELSETEWRQIYKLAYTDEGVILKRYLEDEENIVVPSFIGELPVIQLGEGCFKGKKLVSAVISEGIEAIGKECFANCLALEEIYFPESLKTIGEGAFKDCMVLGAAEFLGGLESIEKEAFLRCPVLGSVSFENPGCTLGADAFRGCQALADEEGSIVVNDVVFALEPCEDRFTGLKVLDPVRRIGASYKNYPYLTYKNQSAAEEPEEGIRMGRFPRTSDGCLGPIRWTKLAEEEGRTLLLAAEGLAAIPFDIYRKTEWEESCLKTWLNGPFFEFAFTKEEQSLMVSDPLAGCKIFVLDAKQAENLLSVSGRKIPPTDFAKAQGAFTGMGGGCCWWLRTKGRDKNTLQAVFDSGMIIPAGRSADRDSHCVVPAVWVETGAAEKLLKGFQS